MELASALTLHVVTPTFAARGKCRRERIHVMLVGGGDLERRAGLHYNSALHSCLHWFSKPIHFN
jgi:hypothetical protein